MAIAIGGSGAWLDSVCGRRGGGGDRLEIVMAGNGALLVGDMVARSDMRGSGGWRRHGNARR